MNSSIRHVIDNRLAKQIATIKQAQMIDEHIIDDLCETLRSVENLDVAFCAYSAENTLSHSFGREIVKAVEVLFLASGGALAGQKRPGLQRLVSSTERQKLHAALDSLVTALQEHAEVAFSFAWRIDSDNDATLYHSSSLSWDEAQENLSDVLMAELSEHLRSMVP